MLLGYDYLSQGIYAQGAFPKIIGGVVGVTVGNAPCKIGDRTTTIGDRTDATKRDVAIAELDDFKGRCCWASSVSLNSKRFANRTDQKEQILLMPPAKLPT